MAKVRLLNALIAKVIDLKLTDYGILERFVELFKMAMPIKIYQACLFQRISVVSCSYQPTRQISF